MIYKDKMYSLIIEGTAVVGIKIKKHADNISVVIPEGITEIGNRAFLNARITHITLPQSLVKICEGAFMSSDLCSITIPKGVKSIEQFIFKNCQKLTCVDMSQTEIEEIPERTFDRCRAIKKVIHSKAQGASDGNETNIFEDAVVLPSTIRTLGRWAFFGCCSIEEVELNEGLETICVGAFEDYNILCHCYRVLPRRIELPLSLKRIESYGIYTNVKPSLTLKKNVSFLFSASFHPSCEIKIVPENPYLYMENGCIITKNKNQLLYGVASFDRPFLIPDGVEIFPSNSIVTDDYGRELKVVVPSSVRKVIFFDPLFYHLTICIPDTVKEVEIIDGKESSIGFNDLQLPSFIKLSESDISKLEVRHRFKINTPLTTKKANYGLDFNPFRTRSFLSAAAAFLEGEYDYDEDVIEKNRAALKAVFENRDTFYLFERYFQEENDDWIKLFSLAIDQNLVRKEAVALLKDRKDYSVEVRSQIINLINSNAGDGLDL